MKYSPYHHLPIVTFDLDGDGSSGWAYFGAFPTNRLINTHNIGRTKIDNDHQQGWKVSA
jgi:hypothetical protein